MKLNKTIIAVIFMFTMSITLGAIAPPAQALDIAIIHADSPSAPVSQLIATGLFNSVADLGNITPTLAQLQAYGAVLAYSNYPFADSTGQGNVLGDYIDAGGGVVVATYAFSGGWSLAGKIMTTGYAPLVIAGMGDVSGSLTAVMPGDPIFTGVNLTTLTYFHNSSFAHPGLDSGATLLATDGTTNMIARNSNGQVIGFNLYPGTSAGGNNTDLYRLLGNSLVSVAGGSVAPIPGSLLLLGSGLLGLAGLRRKK